MKDTSGIMMYLRSTSHTTEFNIEGYPSEEFITLVLSVKPDQVTLVPDPHDAVTSNAGWDTLKNRIFLTEIVSNSGKQVSVHPSL